MFRRALTGCRDRYPARQGPYCPFSRLLRERQKCLSASAQAGAEHPLQAADTCSLMRLTSGWAGRATYPDYAGLGRITHTTPLVTGRRTGSGPWPPSAPPSPRPSKTSASCTSRRPTRPHHPAETLTATPFIRKKWDIHGTLRRGPARRTATYPENNKKFFCRTNRGARPRSAFLSCLGEGTCRSGQYRNRYCVLDPCPRPILCRAPGDPMDEQDRGHRSSFRLIISRYLHARERSRRPQSAYRDTPAHVTDGDGGAEIRRAISAVRYAADDDSPAGCGHPEPAVLARRHWSGSECCVASESALDRFRLV